MVGFSLFLAKIAMTLLSSLLGGLLTRSFLSMSVSVTSVPLFSV